MYFYIDFLQQNGGAGGKPVEKKANPYGPEYPKGESSKSSSAIPSKGTAAYDVPSCMDPNLDFFSAPGIPHILDRIQIETEVN